MLLFRRKTNRADFEREVLQEIAYLRDMHADNALAIARERAARPLLRGGRRRVIEEAVKRLIAEKPSAPSGSR